LKKTATQRKPATRRAGPSPSSAWRARQGATARTLKRAAVIQMAARAFNQRGYHNTSLDDVAELLGVTKPTLYYYVRSKDELLFECFRTGLKPIRAAVKASQKSDRTAHDRLTEVLQRYAEAIASDYGGCMVRAEDLSLSAGLHARVKALMSEIDQGLRRLLRDGMVDGSIARCDPKLAAFALAGALNWIAHWYRGNQGLNASEVARSFVILFDLGFRPRA
jgi:AcrR family transcriptional regulator